MANNFRLIDTSKDVADSFAINPLRRLDRINADVVLPSDKDKDKELQP
jgi:hypothetical protein